MQTPAAWRDDVAPRFDWNDSMTGCFEAWYGKLNYTHRSAPCALWFRYELLGNRADEPPSAHVWGIHFNGVDPSENFHRHAIFPFSSVRLDAGPLDLAIDGDARLSWDSAARLIRSTAGAGEEEARLRWELAFEPREPAFQYASSELLTAAMVSSNGCTPFEDVRFDGTLILDAVPAGRTADRRELREAHGMLGHAWGTRRADGWCWLHANHFTGQSGEPVEAALEALTLSRGPDKRTVTSVFFRLGESIWEANGLLHLGYWNQGEITRGGYRLEASVGNLKLEAYASAEPARAQTFELADADGTTLQAAYTMVADLEVVMRLGGEAPRRLICRHAAALEKARRT